MVNPFVDRGHRSHSESIYNPAYGIQVAGDDVAKWQNHDCFVFCLDPEFPSGGWMGPW